MKTIMNKNKISYYILLLGIIAVPFDLVWQIGVIRFTPVEMLLSVGILLTIIDIVKHREGIINTKYLVPVFVFIGACAVSTIEALSKMVALRETLQYIWLACLFVYVLNEDKKHRIFLPMASILVLISVIVSIAGIYQYYFVREPIHFLITATRSRAHGFYDQPNILGGYLSGIIPLVLCLYFISVSESSGIKSTNRWIKFLFRNRVGLLISLFIFTMGIMAAYSRASWIGVIGCLVLMVIILQKKLEWKQLIVPFSIICLAVSIFMLDLSYSYIESEDSGVTSLLADRGFSNSQRSLLIVTAFSMLRDHPIGGIGIGNFQTRLPEYAPQELIESMQVDYNDSTKTWFINHNKPLNTELVHNMLLQIVVETGLIGLVAMLWVFYVYFRVAYLRFKSSMGKQESYMRAGLIMSVISILIGGLFGWPFSHGVQEILILFMALSVSPIGNESWNC